MHAQYLAAFDAAVRDYASREPRVVNIHDADPILQLTSDHGISRMTLSGRPDGIRPQGFPTVLHQLQSRCAPMSAMSPNTVPPQAWMELEREFVLYQDRARAALAAAVSYVKQNQPRVALNLCAVVLADQTTLDDTMEFAARHHPRQTMTATPPVNRIALAFDHAVATVLHNLLCDDVAAARESVRSARRRIAELDQRYRNQARVAETAQTASRLLDTFDEALNAEAQATPAPTAVLASTGV
jgi:hypothetical protein